MDGIQNRITAAGSNIMVIPDQLLYVCNPTTHVAGASVEIQSNVMKLSYVADSIPAAYAREDRTWELPINFMRHLPTIKKVNELQENV